MKLGIDLGAHFCRAAAIHAGSQPRLLDLSTRAIGSDSSQDVGERGVVRPLCAAVLKRGGDVLLGESAVAAWDISNPTRYAGAAVCTMLADRGSGALREDTFVHYLVRRIASAGQRQFDASPASVCLAGAPASPAAQQMLLRACKLAGVSASVVSAEHASLVSLGPTAVPDRTVLISWGATGLSFLRVPPEAPAKGTAPVEGLKFEELGSAALSRSVIDFVCTHARQLRGHAAADQLRGLDRFAREVCAVPGSLLTFEDSVMLAGERTDLLPLAGLRRLLRGELRARLDARRSMLADWLQPADAGPMTGVILGGVAKNGYLIAYLRAVLDEFGLPTSVARNPEFAVANGAAMLAAKECPSAAMASRFLRCNVAIVRRRDGNISPMSIMQSGVALPAGWSTSLPTAGHDGLKIEIASDGAGAMRTVGLLELPRAQLARAAGAEAALDVRADPDGWMEVKVATNDGRVLASDWYPHTWIDSDWTRNSPSAASIVHDVVE